MHQDIPGHTKTRTGSTRHIPIIRETENSALKNNRMTITDVAQRIGVTPKTIVRWEKAAKVSPAKRDWRGWRVYDKTDLRRLRDFKDTIVLLLGEEHQ